MRRILILAAILLILFLGMYSWNRRTGILDEAATNIGLEFSSAVLSPARSIQAFLGEFWNRYFDLVDVRGENLRLKARVDELEARLMATGEDMAELRRLRELVQFPVDARWRPCAARVLAGRMGPNGVLDSITISRGYANGARPGTPLVTNLGLVGRVLRASAHASTALLITDPGSRVAVFGQESRAAGILRGNGTGKEMAVDYVRRDAPLKDGEILVTSGLDDKYPKGLPVGRVSHVALSDYNQFMAVNATPLVNLQRLEEVLLLEKSGAEGTADEPEIIMREFVGPPEPPRLARTQTAPTQPASTATIAPPVAEPAGPAPHVLTQTPQVAGTPSRPTPAAAAPTPAQTAPPAAQASPARKPPRIASPGEPIPRNVEGAPRYRIITP